MTIQELHYDFKLKLDKVDSLQNANFEDWETDWIINEAIKVYVKNRYKEFEVTQKRIDDLKTLVVESPMSEPAITPTLVSSGIYEVRLSPLTFDYLFYLRGWCTISKDACLPKNAKVRLIQHDDFNSTLLDPFNKPSFLWADVIAKFGKSSNPNETKGSIYLYTNNDFNITKFYIEYLKHPARVSIGTYPYLTTNTATVVQCDLPEHTHNEIVDLAVALTAGIIESPDFLQLKLSKLQINE
jgi:hypothetical protein